MIQYTNGFTCAMDNEKGEVIDEEVLAYCADLRARGEKVMGIDDKGRVMVGRSQSRF